MAPSIRPSFAIILLLVVTITTTTLLSSTCSASKALRAAVVVSQRIGSRNSGDSNRQLDPNQPFHPLRELINTEEELEESFTDSPITTESFTDQYSSLTTTTRRPLPFPFIPFLSQQEQQQQPRPPKPNDDKPLPTEVPFPIYAPTDHSSKIDKLIAKLTDKKP